MNKAVRAPFTTASVIVSLLLWLVLVVYFSFVSTAQKKTSPDGSHRAKLVRVDGIDVNFKFVVDGDEVYSSPDFAPVRDDFREQINWDASGHIVILEVAGQRLFGFDASARRRLTDKELLAVEYPPFANYGFEGKLPGSQNSPPNPKDK